jgi:hypothetical protein
VKALTVVLVLGGCSNQWSGSVAVDENQTALKADAKPPRFESNLTFALVAGTTKANTLPENEPVSVELELTSTTVAGSPVTAKLSGSDLVVDATGRKATWSTFVVAPNGPHHAEARIEADASAVSGPPCGGHVPVVIEVRWTLTPRGSWKIEGPTSGVAKTAPDATAFVECTKAAPPVGPP